VNSGERVTVKRESTANFSRLPARLRRLMNERICDVLWMMRASTAQAPVKRYVENLYEELAGAGLRNLRPEVYFGNEWFSPGGVPAIAMPFYLAHDDLREIELLLTGSVEGGTPSAMRKLLRHEAGHSFDHGYRIPRDFQWRSTFGRDPGVYRPEVYVPDVLSPDHVTHLPGHYAQAHPDEDFAETFAVAITPEMDWESKYRNSPGALRKLRFVRSLIRRHGSQGLREKTIVRTSDASRMRISLARHYEVRLMNEARWERQLRRLAASS